MSAPVIGITVSCGPDPNDKTESQRLYVNRLYADCIAAAGGVPVLIPKQAPVEAVLEIVDGILIPGGDDIDASHFGQQNHPAVKLEDPERFPFENRLLQALPHDLPVLGICYGCQALNVARGGTVEQHIPDRLPQSDHSGGTLQEYEVDPESKLATVLGTDRPKGKSYHHQANDAPGAGLKIVARTADGTVEAVEDQAASWVFGVQWHPERTPQDESTVRLFKSLVNAAAKFRQSRQR